HEARNLILDAIKDFMSVPHSSGAIAAFDPELLTLVNSPWPLEWDEEMERQNPGWSAWHGVWAKMMELPISEGRLKRLRDAGDVPTD
nr:hypothetical protein [Tanacetum cinerariifolium]